MTRLLCCSDIHGYLPQFKRLLERAGYSSRDRLILLGDYIDRGPYSGETLEYVLKLDAIVLRGNHEDMKGIDLPLYHEERGYIFVHAGLRPGIPLEKQTAHDLVWIREDFWLHYAGPPVVFGHTPTLFLPGGKEGEPWVKGGLIGIDFGAAAGLYVGLVEIEDGVKKYWRERV